MTRLFGGLLAAFLFASPAFAADYYFELGTGGGACSEADPCATIADLNALTLNANDNVYFDCGDTFDDAALTADQSGTDGNVITYTQGGPTTCTGNNDPIIGNLTDAQDGVIVTGSFVTFDSLEFHAFADNAQAHGAVSILGGGDITFQNGRSEVTEGTTTELSNNVYISEDTATITTVTFDNWIFFNTPRRLVYVKDDVDGPVNINDSLFDYDTTPNGLVGQYDTISMQGLSSAIDNCTFDLTAFDANQDFSIDYVNGVGTHTLSNSTFYSSPGGAQLHVAGQDGATLTVTVTDTLFDIVAATGEQWMLLRDDAEFTCTRCIWVDADNATRGGIEMREDATAIGPNGTFNANVFIVGTGFAAEGPFEVRDSSTAIIRNSTFISHTNASRDYVISADGAADDAITLENSLIWGDGHPLFVEDAGSTVAFTFDSNLWWRDDQTTAWLTLQTEGTLDQGDVGTTAPVDDDAQGDVQFASEDETSGIFAMLLPGSPGIGAGNSANLYATPATDIHGARFNGATPNAGAASQRITIH